jgi:hypothetical protein
VTRSNKYPVWGFMDLLSRRGTECCMGNVLHLGPGGVRVQCLLRYRLY